MEDQVVEAPVVRDRITHPRDVVRPVSALHHEKLPCAVSETPGGAQERGQRGAQPGELPERQEILKDQIAAPIEEPPLRRRAADTTSPPGCHRSHAVAGYAAASFAINSIASGCSAVIVSPVMPLSAQAR